jgi:glycogen(starch) synthase
VNKVKILILSWEYPPRTIGGLARHVAGLSQALAKNKVDVNVVTVAENKHENAYQEKGVSVYTVPSYSLPFLNFITDIQHLNFSLLEKSIKLINDWGKIDIIHAHDWLVAYAARALKHIYRLPLITTIHATEFGRNGGLYNELQRYISSVEWWLTYESWKVIVCSMAMKQEVQYIFQTPGDKIEIINNGIELADFNLPAKNIYERNRYALPNEKIVFFIGRLVPEKGVQVLIEAIPKILQFEPKVKFIIAGKGPYENYLKHMVNTMGLENKVSFLGFIEDIERNALYTYADCVVFPSIYEPFGIVALEGMAAGKPVVTSDTGGLGEIVEHGINGLKCIPSNADSLAQQIIRVFSDPALVLKMVKKARVDVKEKYSWDGIARQTLSLYQQVINESKDTSWLPPWLTNNSNNKIIGRYEM